jgi:hypothetical protein
MNEQRRLSPPLNLVFSLYSYFIKLSGITTPTAFGPVSALHI